VLIAVSGYGDSTDRERARTAGFDHHLTKPADPVQLADLIDQTSGGSDR
jgi:CheY-like chemotaxis protein